MLDWITDPLGAIIAIPFRFIASFSPHYVLTLLLFAIFMKVVLFPFGIMQQKNSVKQAKLRPYEAIIRKKYAGRTDRVTQQKMQQEIMELYQRENFNPASGCLPMLIQLPVLLALYSVITKPVKFLLNEPDISKKIIDLYKQTGLKNGYEILQVRDFIKIHAGELIKLGEKVKNPSAIIEKINTFLDTTTLSDGKTLLYNAFIELQDKFTIDWLGGINLMDQPDIKNPSLLLLVPVLVFVFQFLSMKLTRKFTYQPPQNNDQGASAALSMKLMDITMPLMSVWISFMTPAAIGIYWMIQSILGVVQQFILYKMFPIPELTEEELREAERELKGKAPKKPQPVREEVNQTAAPAKSAGGKKKNAPKTTAPVITANGKKRVKAHGTVPRAIRVPSAAPRKRK